MRRSSVPILAAVVLGVRFVLAGPTDSDEPTALLFPGSSLLGSDDIVAGFEPDPRLPGVDGAV